MDDFVSPHLHQGEILLFDHRCLHNGGANLSGVPRPVAYVIYAVNEARDVHNFPAESLRDFCARGGDFC